MFALIICVALLSLTPDVRGKCIDMPQLPDGITIHKVVSTWDEAHKKCESEDAVLASPITTKLLNDMISLISIHNTQYFIGVKYSQYPGPFVSVEGVPLDNMTAAIVQMVERLDPRDGGCLAMNKDSIRVVPCCMELPFMCYKDPSIVEPTTPAPEVGVHNEQCGTDEDFKYYKSTSSCYKFHKEEKKWDDAVSACEAEGTHLVVIDDAHEAEMIKNMGIKQKMPYTHIGIRDYSEGRDHWKSVNNKPLADIFNVWAYGHATGVYKYCGALMPSGKIDNYDCTTESDFICEKDISIKL